MSFEELINSINKQELESIVKSAITSQIDLISEIEITDEKTYNEIKELDLYDFMCDSNPDMFVGYLEPYCEEVDEYAEDFAEEFKDYLIESVDGNSQYENIFDKEKEKLLAKYINLVESYDKSDTDDEYADFDSDDCIHDTTSLVDNNDNVGDSFQIETDIDYLTRERAFVYLDGEIIAGRGTETHSQIINHYLRDNNMDTISDDYDEKKVNSRPYMKQVQVYTGSESVAMGHIDNDMAFIETTKNCDVNDVKQALLDSYDFSKIYLYIRNSNGGYLKRLAMIEI